MRRKKNEIRSIRNRLQDSRIFSRSLRPPFPKNMLVELTNACNNRCIFCANRKMTRKVGRINIKLLNRILWEAYSLGARSIGFYATGEPFVSDKLAKSIAMAKRIGFSYIYLTTNGVLATPSRIRDVIKAGLDSIKFSINAGTPETYKLIHGTDTFSKVLNNLKFVSEYRKKINRPLKIYISYLVTRQSQEECARFKGLVSPLVDDILFTDVINQGGMMYGLERISAHKKNDDKIAFSKKAPCNMVFNRAHITCEGYLTICCVDYQNYLVVADLNKTSLKEAWCNNVFIEIRRRHLQNKLKGTQCYNCIYNKNDKVKPLLPEYATIYKSGIL